MPDLIISDPYDLIFAAPDAVYVYAGPFTGGGAPLTPADSSASFLGSGTDGLGRSLAMVPDFDGDGCEDLVIGSPYTLTQGVEHGRVILVPSGMGYGPLTPVPSPGMVVIEGVVPGSRFGFSLDAAGDFDGDGTQDLVVGAPSVNGAPGGVWVVFDLPALAAGGGVVPANTVAAVYRERPGSPSMLGWSVSGSHDIDSDGYSEILFGDELLQLTTGRAYLATGAWGNPAPGVVIATDDPTAVAWLPGTRSSGLGGAVVFTDDVDGDGCEDALLTATSQWLGPATLGRIYIHSSRCAVRGPGPLPLPTRTIDAVQGTSFVATTLDGGGESDGTPGSDPHVGFMVWQDHRYVQAVF